jgi:hypothetical protein
LRAILVHYHIFKNAGTTVDSILADNFGQDFAHLDSLDALSILSCQDLVRFVQLHSGVRALSSHTLPPPKPNVSGLIFFDCILIRHPLDRLSSMYEFYRRADICTDPLSLVAKKLDAAQFFTVLIEHHPNIVNNGQVNYLNGGRRISREPDLQRALKIVNDCSILGVTEWFDECMVAAEQVLQTHFGTLDFSYLSQNVTPGRINNLGARLQQIRTRCGDQLYERLLKLNRLDLELLDAAATEAHRRFERIPDREKLMANFLDRCKKRAQEMPVPLASI